MLGLHPGYDHRGEAVLLHLLQDEVVQKSLILTGDVGRVAWLEGGASSHTLSLAVERRTMRCGLISASLVRAPVPVFGCMCFFIQ